jgi:pyrroline-5-carboxylate reductase
MATYSGGMTAPIIIIGGGAMGLAMAQRFGQAAQVVEPDAARRDVLKANGITCYSNLAEAPLSERYVLAIKPQQFEQFTQQWQAVMAHRQPVLLSIMAGITLAQLQLLSTHAVRVMPNLPAQIGESMSVACAPALDAALRAEMTQLLGALGRVAWVEDEQQIHAVTAISGSGPAYVFAFMEALQQAAIAQGLSPELARLLVTQTVRGAALLADQSAEDAATLRAQVTSKGGTTQAALEAFAKGGFVVVIRDAVEAAATRSRQLAESL